MARKAEIIYGLHATRHAVQHAPTDVLELWIMKDRDTAGEIAEITGAAISAGIAVHRVSRHALDKLCAGANHQGVAVRRKSKPAGGADLQSMLDNIAGKVPLLLVLDGVQDPHNLGACLRTANAAGVDAVIIPGDRAVTVNATVRKVASGAAEYTPVITVTNLARALTQIQATGIWCFGLTETAETDIYASDLTVPLALIVGAEGKGLRQNTRDHCDQLLCIPMRGQVESLNVSAAAAICLFEAVRQRGRTLKSATL